MPASKRSDTAASEASGAATSVASEDAATRVGPLASSRSSVRGYLAAEIPRSTLEILFDTARCAPSWCNIQPWHVAVTQPPATAQLTGALLKTAKTSLPSPDIAFPGDYPAPYRARRGACGGALYSAMGIERDDKDGRYAAWLRNYQAFDAPHIAIVSRQRTLGEYATLDVGVWLGYLLLTAQDLGVATCPLGSLAGYPEVLRRHLDIPSDHDVLFGIALGYRDPAHAANRCQTVRAPTSSQLRWFGELARPNECDSQDP